MCMPSDRYVVVTQPELNLVSIFNLESKLRVTFRFEFMIDLGCHSQVDYFCESGLLCIKEEGDNTKLVLKLSYFDWKYTLDRAVNNQ